MTVTHIFHDLVCPFYIVIMANCVLLTDPFLLSAVLCISMDSIFIDVLSTGLVPSREYPGHRAV